MEAGHFAQYVFLEAGALGRDCCALCAFDDGEVDRVLEFGGEQGSVVYLLALGPLSEC
jgi:hypothetical protein